LSGAEQPNQAEGKKHFVTNGINHARHMKTYPSANIALHSMHFALQLHYKPSCPCIAPTKITRVHPHADNTGPVRYTKATKAYIYSSPPKHAFLPTTLLCIRAQHLNHGHGPSTKDMGMGPARKGPAPKAWEWAQHVSHGGTTMYRPCFKL